MDNREIKFRGWDFEHKKWRYGYVCNRFYYGKADLAIQESNNRFYVDPKSVGQYTGLKDKNGTEIYEGDILQLTGQAVYNRRVVLFKNGSFGYKDHLGVFCVLHEMMDFIKQEGYPKVIGNKFENPELLEDD